MKAKMPGRFDVSIILGGIFLVLWVGLGIAGAAWLVVKAGGFFIWSLK